MIKEGFAAWIGKVGSCKTYFSNQHTFLCKPCAPRILGIEVSHDVYGARLYRM